MMLIEELFWQGMDRNIPCLVDPPGGLALNVGAGNKVIEGAIPLDYPEWDADKDPLPFDNNEISTIHAYHFLEHIRDPVGMLLEFQRTLMVGGVINIVVPYYTSQMAAHDLDHKHVFCEETWRVMLGNPYYDKHKIEWKLKVGTNVIMGVVERNLALITQLVRTP